MRRVGPEEALLRQVLALARLRGWVVYHQRPARTAQGWRTALSGDPGFPDLVLCRGDRLVFIELKSDTGRTSQAQRVWLSVLGQTAAEVYLFRPADWSRIEEVLR